MHFVVMLTIIVSAMADFAVRDLRILPNAAKLLPEAMSAMALVYVVLAGIAGRFRYVRAEYWLLFGTLGVVMLAGAITNSLAPGPMIAGMRYYLRAIPFFLLPAVIAFTDRQVRQQLMLLTAICLIQFPLAAWQRLTLLAEHRTTGDPVYGTMMISSVMSMFLIGATCIALGLFLKKRIGPKLFTLLFFLFLIPTTINETKGTLILLPLALYTCLMFGSPPEKRLKLSLGAAALLAGFLAIYVPAYNYFNTKNAQQHQLESLTDFLTDEEVLERYLHKDAGIGTRKNAGRVDSVTVPLEQLSKDPAKLVFGVGIGNASHSTLGLQFIGHYFALYGRYAETTTAGALILEIGVLGLVLVLLLYWAIFRDARVVAKHDDGHYGGIAVGVLGIAVLAVLATFYKPIHVFESLSYMFWYFAGTVAAQRMRLSSSPAFSGPTEVRPRPSNH